MVEMESDIDILQEINKNMTLITDEVKVKRIEMETVKLTIRQQKSDYNHEIKEYSNLMKMIINEEQKLENLEKNLIKIRFKQKMNLTRINNDFVKHFMDFAGRVEPEIVHNLIEFFGFSVTPFSLLKKIINREEEFRNIMEHSEILNSYLERIVKKPHVSILTNDWNDERIEKSENTTNLLPNSKIKDKIMNIYSKHQNNLQYPFDCIFDHILSIYSLLELNDEKEVVLGKIENLQNKKNFVFMGLKNLESEIMKNDSGYRVYSKYIKSINKILDRFKELKENNSLDFGTLNEFLKQLKDFKRINLNILRKYDNINSLTLKSEYSEEFSEIISHVEDYNNNNFKLTPIKPQFENEIRNHIEMNKLENTESIETIVHGLTRIKTEDNKNKMKNAKKIKNKKLQLSETNSDLDITDNIKKPNTGKKNILSKDLKEMKSNKAIKAKNNIFNFNITIKKTSNKQIITSRPGFKQLKEEKNGNFSKTHNGGFKLNHQKRKTSITTSNFSINTIEKGQSQFNTNKDFEVMNKIERSSEEISNSPTKEESNLNLQRNSETFSPIIQMIKAESSGSIHLKNNINPTNSETLVLQTHLEQLESVCDEWIISPLNKIQVRASKMISDKPLRAKTHKSMPDYLNLKIDKPINNVSGCCVSCV